MDVGEIIGIGAIGVLLAVGAFFLNALFVLLAWNLIASIFGVITISYVQAIGVTIALWLIRGVPQIKSDK